MTYVVADHPAVPQMKSLWEQGYRAATINLWLEENEYEALPNQTLNKFGYRNWNQKVDIHWDDDPLPRIEEAISQIEGSGQGTVTKTTFVQKAYPAWKREAQGLDAVSFDGKTTSISLSVTPNLKCPLERSQKTDISLPYLPTSSPERSEIWHTGVFLPDQQFGFRDDGDELVPTHDEVAIDLAHQIIASLQETEGVDLIVNAGDSLDLPAFSTHRSAPGYLGTTQYALDRVSQEAAIQRALAPESEIVWLQGNHEQRLTNFLADKAPALVGLTRANEDEPILSIPYLCRFDDYDVTYIDGYPNGKYWANDHLLFIHGDKHSSAPGATARNQLAKGVSIGYGHIHRSELLYDRRSTRHGSTSIFAGSPGCLARIDGALPSTRSGILANGKQSTEAVENWSQGIWVFKYQTVGDQLSFVDPVQFNDGFTLFRGVPMWGVDRIEGETAVSDHAE